MEWFWQKDSESKTKLAQLEKKLADMQASSGTFKPLFHLSYDGEKNSGELGHLTEYHLDYRGLRARSWKAYLDDEITQTVVKRYVIWVIGGGLKLQAEPNQYTLEQNKISINHKTFTKGVEERFKIYSESTYCDWHEKDNLNELARQAKINAIVGGDCLTVLRLEKGHVKIQLIDGGHVKTPYFGNEIITAEKKGNKIKDGIEYDIRGRVIAYHVQTKWDKSERILARNSLGQEMAFMVYGFRYRLDDKRGIPLVSAVLETLAKLDRYKEAVVGSAEERAKIVFQIVHEAYSTGENPMVKNMMKAFNADSQEELPVDASGKTLANTVAATTNKQTFNMPPGAKMSSLDSQQELQFEQFWGANVNAICSAMGIPPEVALSKYDSNFSASRAALKDWEHTINVERKQFANQFYQKIYSFWFHTQALLNKIQPDGYLLAFAKNDREVLDSYLRARFVGSTVPHIDPVKEVKAERLKLGNASNHIPLTTVEAATEALNGGEYDGNIERYLEEVEKAKDLKPVEDIKEESEE